MNFVNKKFNLTSLTIILASLFFLTNVSPTLAVRCEKDQSKISFFSKLNPLLDFAEKTIKEFGYDVALAAPVSCSSNLCMSTCDVGCSAEGVPYAIISWEGTPESLCGTPIAFYAVFVTGMWPMTAFSTSYTVSGLANGTNYEWAVDAVCNYSGAHLCGYPIATGVPPAGDRQCPRGSFTTPICYTYSWQTGSWGACSPCSRPRSVWCQRSDGATVADSYCSGTKPDSTDTSGCNGAGCDDGNSCTAPDTCTNGVCSGPNNPRDGGWSEWNACSLPCGNGVQTQTCTNPTPSCGGASCPSCNGPGCPNTNTRPCNIQPCNKRPSAVNLSDNTGLLDYCFDSPSNIIPYWTFFDNDPGDTQLAYQVQVTRQSDGATYDSGKQISGTSNTTAQKINSDYGSNFIWYGSSYTWRVRVWDNHDLDSVWSSYSSFPTPSRQYPAVSFTWSPNIPSVNETVQFTNLSDVYIAGTPNWLWSFPTGIPSATTTQNPIVKFSSAGTKTVTLTVTDSGGLSCTAQATLNTLLRPPDWTEVPPF